MRYDSFIWRSPNHPLQISHTLVVLIDVPLQYHKRSIQVKLAFGSLLPIGDFHFYFSLSIHLLILFKLDILGRFLAIHQLSYRVQLFLPIRYTPSQTLFRCHYVPYFCLFGLFDVVQHVVFDGVLPLVLKDEALVQLICHFLVSRRLFHLQLEMRLLDSFTDDLKAFRRDKEGGLDFDLFRVNIDGEGVVLYLVFLILQELLKVLVILRSQRHHHTRLSLFLTLLRDLIEVLFIYHDLELCGGLVHLCLFFLGDEDYLGQVFNGIGDDIVDELIVHPQEAHLQGFIGGGACFGGYLRCGGCELVEIGCHNFVEGFPLSFHLPEYHLVTLALLDDLGVLVEEMHLSHFYLFGGLDVEHVAVVVLHRVCGVNIISLQVQEQAM